MSYRKIPKPILSIIRQIRRGEIETLFNEECFNLKISLEADIFVFYKNDELGFEIKDGDDVVLTMKIDISKFGDSETIVLDHVITTLKSITSLLSLSGVKYDAPKGK